MASLAPTIFLIVYILNYFIVYKTKISSLDFQKLYLISTQEFFFS